ncbi:hypothetical protein DL95DRAFT_388530 [Leptodontidium sp. 2 PMI_412]|nr:hypothetical protein DL95DRAFT_388530 [Leptodontidium sp. 2 PMI_412]
MQQNPTRLKDCYLTKTNSISRKQQTLTRRNTLLPQRHVEKPQPHPPIHHVHSTQPQ